MFFDVFSSLSQTPRPDGRLPSHAEVLRDFVLQAVAADDLGYSCLWIAESHFSSELQKQHARPVIPDWAGEICVNSDTAQLAHEIFRRTRRIDLGSAITNIVACGGPIVAAERVANLLAWHGLEPSETRRFRVGFASGRFDFIARTTGIVPVSAWEEAAWPQVKSAILREAGEVFVRLLNGESIAAADIAANDLSAADFRSVDDYVRVLKLAGRTEGSIPVPRRWDFEATKIVPEFRRDLLQLVVGSTDDRIQTQLNRHAPVQVFNLSIAPPAVIEATHRRMAEVYHPSGGAWQRSFMPRTTMVFLDATPGLSRAARNARAGERSGRALEAYWQAMTGTIDAHKVAEAADNALVGAPEEVCAQIVERFDPTDRLMLWFDFFPDDAGQVLTGMEAFATQVMPLLADRGVTAEMAL